MNERRTRQANVSGAGGTAGVGAGRVHRGDHRRRRRRRRFGRALVRLVIWALVLGAVFIFGIGYGREVAGNSGHANGRSVKLRNDRGIVTSTQPTVTVTRTVTVVKTVKAKARKKAAVKHP